MIDNKKLSTLIKLLRKNGVKHFKSPELSLELGELPSLGSHSTNQGTSQDLPVETYSDEQTLFWSSGGVPQENEQDS